MTYYQHRFEHIDEYLHHRPPYLLVEKIDSLEERQIITSKQVTEGWAVAGQTVVGQAARYRK